MNAPLHDHKLCPSCGVDFLRDVPVMIDRWSMFGDGYPLCYEGRPLRLPHAEASLCWTLMKAFPRTVSHDAILNRIGSEGSRNTISVHLSRIRNRLRELSIPFPIESIHSQGYAWLTEAEALKRV